MDSKTYRQPRTFAELEPSDTFTLGDTDSATRFRREHNPTGYSTAGGCYGWRPDPIAADVPVYRVETHEESADKYQAARDAEREEANKRTQAFHGIMRKVAAALGMTWEHKKQKDDMGRYDARGELLGDGLTVSAGLGGYRLEGRISIHGVVPREDGGPWGVSVCDITVAADKAPERIAKDIASRVVPAYRVKLKEAQERKASADDYKARRAANVALLVKAGGKAAGSHSVNTVYLDGGHAECGADSVNLRIDVSPAIAARIVRMLGKGE